MEGGGVFAKVNLPLGAQMGHPLCQVDPSTGGQMQENL